MTNFDDYKYIIIQQKKILHIICFLDDAFHDFKTLF